MCVCQTCFVNETTIPTMFFNETNMLAKLDLLYNKWVHNWLEWKLPVVAFHTVNLCFLGRPCLANNLFLNALVIAFACAVLDSTSWSYLCGPALIEPKCLYCLVIPISSSPKRGWPTCICWLPAVTPILTLAAPFPINCKRNLPNPGTPPHCHEYSPDKSALRELKLLSLWALADTFPMTSASKINLYLSMSMWASFPLFRRKKEPLCTLVVIVHTMMSW